MTFNQFLVQLGLTTLIAGLLLLLLNTVSGQNTFGRLAIGTIVFFIATLTLFFLWGKQSAQSKDLNAFSRMALLSISLKMFLAIGLVVVYVKMIEPQSNFFVVPFLTIYFTYTIFETYFLMRLARETPNDGA